MREILELFIHLFCTIFKLLKPGGVKTVMVENLVLKQQLIALNRSRQRSPNLKAFDRFFYGLACILIGEKRVNRIAVILTPATLLKFHKALIKRKYKELYSNKTRKKSGRKAPPQALIDLVLEMKEKNSTIGYGRISMQIYKTFGVIISRFAVGRILRKHYKYNPSGNSNGPSWLSFIGHLKDSLWSVDLFRCESILLKSHWVMVVIDQYTRRIIGFAVHLGNCDGVAYCRLFNKITTGYPHPKYLSSDNDPLFLFHRWKANLRIIGIKEIKSIPGVPTSHPFVERVIGTTRRECLDKILFFNTLDLQNKLGAFQTYYNETRIHSSLELKTPSTRVVYHQDTEISKQVVSIDDYKWKSHCKGLYNFPIAA